MYQNSDSSNAYLNQKEEISLFDMLLFLKWTLKIIAIFAVIGLGTAPNSNINPLDFNIEEAGLLIARMSFRSYYWRDLVSDFKFFNFES